MRHNLPNDFSHLRGTSMHYGIRAMAAMSLRISELCLSFSPHPNIPEISTLSIILFAVFRNWDDWMFWCSWTLSCNAYVTNQVWITLQDIDAGNLWKYKILRLSKHINDEKVNMGVKYFRRAWLWWTCTQSGVDLARPCRILWKEQNSRFLCQSSS